MIAKKLGLLSIALVAATFSLSAPVSLDHQGSLAANAAFARGFDDADDLDDLLEALCRRGHERACMP